MLTQEITKQKLKTQLIEKLGVFDEHRLLMIHQFVSKLIADELVDSVSKDWESNIVDRQAIHDVINEYRNNYTYGENVSSNIPGNVL